jgi:hypothetical protein
MPEPMLIPTETIPRGVVICKSHDCQFEACCANHETAGDFRTMDGFTPALVRHGPEWGCETMGALLDSVDRHECMPCAPHGEVLGLGAYCENGDVCIDFMAESDPMPEPHPLTFRQHLDAAEESLYQAWHIGQGSRGYTEREYTEIVACRHALSRLMQVATD